MSARSFLTALLLIVLNDGAACANPCRPSDPPHSWSERDAATPATAPFIKTFTPALNLVVFRHGEKPLRDNGVMIEDGNLGVEAEDRLRRLPEKLLKEFGCPDLLVAPNPAIKMLNKKTNQYFNYIRPLLTIAPVSMRLNYPVWTPYGYDQSDLLARDFIGDPALKPKEEGASRTIFVAWERQNIPKLYRELVNQGKLKDLAGRIVTIDGAPQRCDVPQPWTQCDFDSIWFIRIRNEGVCLTRHAENLDTASYQEKCKGAESVSDVPK